MVEAGHRSIAVLEAAGFTPVHREQRWRVPLRSLSVGSSRRSTQWRIISAGEADLERLAALDNANRSDMPGADGWDDDVEGFAASLDDDQFDPRLNLIAVDQRSGEYVGLIRIWWRVPHPRFGGIGVTRACRRTGSRLS